MNQIVLNIATGLPGFLIGIVAHEWAHAYVAYRFGDKTAKYAGRLTFNPAAHIDPVGTILFPLIGASLGWMMFGWAKPVPVDARRFKNMRSGMFWVSFAGPGMNILLGILFCLMYAVIAVFASRDFYFYNQFLKILKYGFDINFILAAFNLIPFPPLDGSKMVSSQLSYNNAAKFEGLQRYSFVFILIMWFTPILNIMLTPAVRCGEVLATFFFEILVKI